MHDELVHVSCLLRKPRNPIAALLRGPELVLEEGIVLRANDGEVVGHIVLRLLCVAIVCLGRLGH